MAIPFHLLPPPPHPLLPLPPSLALLPCLGPQAELVLEPFPHDLTCTQGRLPDRTSAQGDRANPQTFALGPPSLPPPPPLPPLTTGSNHTRRLLPYNAS